MFENITPETSKRQRAGPRPPPREKKTPVAAKVAPWVIGAFADQKKLSFVYSSIGRSPRLRVAESDNSVDYQMTDGSLPVTSCSHIQLGSIDIGRFAVMTLEKRGLVVSLSRDQKTWSRPIAVAKSSEKETVANGVLVPDYQLNGAYVMFIGGKRIRIATSRDARKWQMESYPPLDIQTLENESLELDLAKKLPNGILLCYRRIVSEGAKQRQEVHMALVDKNNPTRIIWRSPSPIWEDSPEWGETSFGGSAVYRSEVFSFWNTSRMGIVLVRYPVEGIPFQLPRDYVISLDKARSNPVIFPRGEFSWESFATYNPAAFHADGRVHILYRAQGRDLTSSIGYASSRDGVTIDERLEKPVYLPQEVFESYQKASPAEVEQKYVSGGGIAGCEDPRVTLMGDRVYMTYVAFDGASPPRVALTSIALGDFLAKRWLWQRPVLISPPGIVDKSAVIFPEKINGKYVIMHRIFPDIQIDYEDDLNFDGSHWLREDSKISIRDNMWDSRKIGAGAPPIKTSEGWLLIYYGVDDRDDRFYKMGAMLLDLEDPSKVLYRSSTPIVEPEDWYENSGFKPGIVYPCGAVILAGKLLVYYGGADNVVCVASRDLDSFLLALKSNHELRIEKQTALKINYHATHATQIQPHPYS